MEYYFRKAWNDIGEAFLIVYEQGKFAKPIIIIESHQINVLINVQFAKK